MRNLFIFLVLLLICSVTSELQAQYNFMRYGKINEDELKMKYYPGDSTAEALVLGDYGFIYFRINNKGDNWEMVYERHTRIKIFHKNAFKYGNVILPLYKQNSIEERVTSLKGTTYFIENEKVVKESLRKENRFKEEISNRWMEEKFALPALREGCIIEYEYTICSEYFFSMPVWNFQRAIPCVQSSMHARIPEYFKYYTNLKGYLTLNVNETEMRTESFTIPYVTTPQAGGLVERGKYEIKSNSLIRHWEMKNIPAFKTEPYMNHEGNYLSALSFELSSFNFPGQQIVPFTDTWESVSKQLLEDEYFGEQIKRAPYLKDELALICQSTQNEAGKLAKIYAFVRDNYKWNRKYSVYASKNLRKINADRAGNSADINLTLIAALSECGFTVVPAVLSTRDKGMILPTHPSINQLNHVIAQVDLNGKSVLLDATEAYCPPGMLPEQCINGNAYLVKKDKSTSLDLTPTEGKVILAEADFQLDEQAKCQGTMKKTYKAYAAMAERQKIKKLDNTDKVLDARREKNPSLNFDHLQVQNLEDLSQPLIITYNIALNDLSATGPLYINPFIDNALVSNPFTQEVRLHPVDFIFPLEETCLFKISLPDSYEVIEKPESVIMSLPDNSAKLTYNSVLLGNQLQITYKFVINKIIYMPDEYADLKAMFSALIKKQSENIVIRKKA